MYSVTETDCPMAEFGWPSLVGMGGDAEFGGTLGGSGSARRNNFRSLRAIRTIGPHYLAGARLEPSALSH